MIGLPSHANGLPRDGTVICQRPEDREKNHGRRVVVASDVDSLTAGWSEACRRFPAVVVEGDKAFHERVNYLCHVTAANVGNTIRRGRSWVTNLVNSLPILGQYPCIDGIKDYYKGVPAFIVGAGPSLDADRDHLPMLRKTGLVLAVNAGSQAVDAHIVVTNESNDQSAKTDPTGALLVTGPQAHPGVREKADAVAWCFSGELGQAMADITHRSTTPCCSSGTSIAFSIATLAGCDPIVLVGQDLAFPSDQLYADATGWGGTRLSSGTEKVFYDWDDKARGQDRGDVGLPEEEGTVMVPAVGGGMVPTVRSWEALGRWLLSAAGANGVGLYQTSRTGAALGEHRTLEYLLKSFDNRGESAAPHLLPNIDQVHVDAFIHTEKARLKQIAINPSLARETKSPLFDAWSYAAVAHFLDERREPPVDGVYAEYKRARRDRVKLNAIVREQANELRALLDGMAQR